MRRQDQTLDEIFETLSPIDAAWMDGLAELVIASLQSLPEKPSYTVDDVAAVLDPNFDAGLTVIRLFLDMSKDEFTVALREKTGQIGTGVTAFRKHRREFAAALAELGTLDAIRECVHRPARWSDILVERLKSGRGSAIKGQRRGKHLEDFTERFVEKVFGKGNYDVRCRFLGETGQSTEKADFAIPSKSEPRVLIEVKAYGATGSKQTDVLGDVSRIVDQKRHDTTLLLVTDGVTWRDRANDMRKLVKLQNRGRIGRIYTLKMADEMERDLEQLKQEYEL